MKSIAKMVEVAALAGFTSDLFNTDSMTRCELIAFREAWACEYQQRGAALFAQYEIERYIGDDTWRDQAMATLHWANINYAAARDQMNQLVEMKGV